MANDKTVTGLDPAGTLDGTEVFYIVQDGNSREIDLDTLVAYITVAASIVPENLPYRGCRVSRSSTQTSITWPIVVSWQTEDFDSDGFWSVGDPTRIYIPAGVTKVKLSASVALTLAAATGSNYCEIRKNGTGTSSDPVAGSSRISARNGSSGGTDNDAQSFTAVLDVEEGDYFDVLLASNVSGVGTLLTNAKTWFALEVVEADLV